MCFGRLPVDVSGMFRIYALNQGRTVSSSSASPAHRPLCSCDAVPLGVWAGVGWQEMSDLLYLHDGGGGRCGESVRVNTKATVPLLACALTSDSVLWKESSSSGNIYRVHFFPQYRKEKCKIWFLFHHCLKVSQVELCLRRAFP